jgi:nitroreductase
LSLSARESVNSNHQPKIIMNLPRRDFLRSSALLGSALLLGRTATPAAAAGEPAVPVADIWAVFKQRRSVRKFRPDAVPEADLKKMIDAARLAPTSGNQQPWKFLVVRDPDKISQMKEACVQLALGRFADRRDQAQTREQYEQGFRNRIAGYFSAPVYIVILTDNNAPYPDYNHWDGPMAAGYLMLAARALGYGTVFITDSIPESVTKTVLHIPDNYTRVCITPVGIPVEWPEPKPKKPLDDLIAYESL